LVGPRESPFGLQCDGLLRRPPCQKRGGMSSAPPPAKRGSSILETLFTPVTVTANVVTGTANEAGSLLTTGKTTTTRKNEAAVKLQAAMRGKQARAEVAKQNEGKTFTSSSWLCVGRGKPGAEDSSWLLCGCGGRSGKEPPTKVPTGGLPGVAKHPSFPRREYPEEMAAQRLAK
jgi:hypothetical protein